MLYPSPWHSSKIARDVLHGVIALIQLGMEPIDDIETVPVIGDAFGVIDNPKKTTVEIRKGE